MSTSLVFISLEIWIFQNYYKFVTLQAIGIFLQGCFLFNFATLMEYSVASYIERRRTRHNQKLNNNICSDSESEPASKKNSVTASSIFPTKGTTKMCASIDSYQYLQIIATT